MNHLNLGGKTKLKQMMMDVEGITLTIKLNLKLQCQS